MADAAATLKVKILDCKLYVRKVKISPSVFIAHSKALEGGTLNILFVVPSVKRIRYQPETWLIPRKTYSPVNYPPVLSWDV